MADPAPHTTVDTALPPVTLVLGGARSGKSAHAEAYVERGRQVCVYLATAQAGDAEMAARIAAHQARRGEFWTTVEEPLDLAGVLGDAARGEAAVLVDCLTLWIANLMAASRDVDDECRRLVDGPDGLGGPVVFVANEVGLGIVPDNAQARAFRDHAGRLNQRLAARADRVVLGPASFRR